MTKAQLESYRLDLSVDLAEAVRKLKQNFNLNFVAGETTVSADNRFKVLFNFKVTLPSGKDVLFTTGLIENDLILLPNELCKKHGWKEDDPRIKKLSIDEQNVLRFANWLYSYYLEHKN